MKYCENFINSLVNVWNPLRRQSLVVTCRNKAMRNIVGIHMSMYFVCLDFESLAKLLHGESYLV